MVGWLVNGLIRWSWFINGGWMVYWGRFVYRSMIRGYWVMNWSWCVDWGMTMINSGMARNLRIYGTQKDNKRNETLENIEKLV